MPSTLGRSPLIPGLVDEVALEIFIYFAATDLDGPSTLMLVCTAWRDTVLRSASLRSLRRDRRRCASAPMENREKAKGGICIVSFDGGGPGSMSQLRMLDECMTRLAFDSGAEDDELLPADYFDMMGGVGFGGLVALLLGRLRMTTSQAMKELATIGGVTFRNDDGVVNPEANLTRLRKALETMLVSHGHSAGIKLRNSSDNRCKVVLFAAPTAATDHCQPFRSYRSPRKCPDCTFVDAACATMATPEYFSPVAIGPEWRKQSFAGIPYGFNNPAREVLKEAQLMFGENRPVSLVLSLGSGQRAPLSDQDHHVTRLSHIHCDSVAKDLQYQLRGFGVYLRLNVDKGMENIELDSWNELGSIETYTNVYVEMNQITRYIDEAFQWLLRRNGSVTLGQLSGTSTDCVVKFGSETLKDYLAMEFKQMHNIVQNLGIERITLVDAIGNNIPIPMEFCLTYSMLLDVIGIYFRHQKPPGSDFVKRGDYRLVHGDRKHLMGPINWARIEKVGLKVEMSIVLRTRNQSSTRCPRGHTEFEGSALDGWAQCLSCSTQFQIETRVQPDDTNQTKDTNRSGSSHLIESHVSPGVSEPESSKVQNAEHMPSSEEPEQLKFRLISVINLLKNRAKQKRHPFVQRPQPNIIRFPTLFSSDFGPTSLLHKLPANPNPNSSGSSFSFGSTAMQNAETTFEFGVPRPTFEFPIEEILKGEGMSGDNNGGAGNANGGAGMTAWNANSLNAIPNQERFGNAAWYPQRWLSGMQGYGDHISHSGNGRFLGTQTHASRLDQGYASGSGLGLNDVGHLTHAGLNGLDFEFGVSAGGWANQQTIIDRYDLPSSSSQLLMHPDAAIGDTASSISGLDDDAANMQMPLSSHHRYAGDLFHGRGVGFGVQGGSLLGGTAPGGMPSFARDGINLGALAHQNDSRSSSALGNGMGIAGLNLGSAAQSPELAQGLRHDHSLESIKYFEAVLGNSILGSPPSVDPSKSLLHDASTPPPGTPGPNSPPSPIVFTAEPMPA